MSSGRINTKDSARFGGGSAPSTHRYGPRENGVQSGDPAPKRRTRYNQPFASASFAASDRFLQPNFWIAFER